MRFALMTFVSFCLFLQGQVLAQGGGTVGGPGEDPAPVCYRNDEYDCANILTSLINDYKQPLLRGCGPCYIKPNVTPQQYVCPVADLNGIYTHPSSHPNFATKYPWVKPSPSSGKKAFTEGNEVTCGEIYSCSSVCYEVNGEYFCERSLVGPYKVKTRQNSGDNCAD
jgi:hypothetical protein